MTREAAYVIAAIAAVVNRTQTPTPPDGLDWVAAARLAVKHSVGNLFCYAIEGFSDVPEEVRGKLIELKRKAILREATQETELSLIRAKFTEKNIRFLPLKGIMLKTYYPKPDMRMMGDIDILFDPSRDHEVRDILLGMGYSAEEFDNGVSPDVYYKRPIMNIELHRELLSRPQEWKPHFADVWERVVSCGACEFAMTPEEFYVFLMAHLVKHYVGYGTGIRSVLDLWVYRNGQKLDEAVVARRFEDLGITEFVQNIEALSAVWFGGAEHTPLTDEMGEFVLDSGTYGERLTAVMAKTEATGSAKREYFFRRLFLNREMMEYGYPILKKAPVLLPACWVIRWCKKLLRRDVVTRELHMLNAVDGEKAKKLQEFHRRAGLKESFYQE